MLQSQSPKGTIQDFINTTQHFGIANVSHDQQIGVDSERAVAGNFRADIDPPEEIIREEKEGWDACSNDPNLLTNTNLFVTEGGISHRLDELMASNGANLEFRSIGSENSDGPSPIRRSESSIEDALELGALSSNDFHFSSLKDTSLGSPNDFFRRQLDGIPELEQNVESTMKQNKSESNVSSIVIKKLPPRDSPQDKADESKKNMSSQNTIEDQKIFPSLESREEIPAIKILTATDQRAKRISLFKQKTNDLEDKENSPEKYKPSVFTGRSKTKHKTEVMGLDQAP